jgi:hypothetical protein
MSILNSLQYLSANDYKLIPKKTAFVYAMAVSYICVELNPCKTVAIPDHLHLDIVKSLE